MGFGIGAVMAEVLLKHFGSVEAIMTASIHELVCVEKIGLKTAGNIRELVGGAYKK